MKLCKSCDKQKAKLLRPKTKSPTCINCFTQEFESEIHQTIISNNLFTQVHKKYIQTNKYFKKNQKVGVCASGGKDSTVLIHILHTLNNQYNYGLDLELISIDEGIKGYRDDSLETVKENSRFYKLPLTILSFKDLYGFTMDEIAQINQNSNNCTYCGVFRRQAMDKAALQIKADIIATGHNADDLAETVLMNFLRADASRLPRSVDIISGKSEVSQIRRTKPFKYAYEKEIVLYAHYKKLTYFCTECLYAPTAFRGYARELIKPTSILDIIHSGEFMAIQQKAPGKVQQLQKCQQCGYMSSQQICQACALVVELQKGKAKKEIIQTNN